MRRPVLGVGTFALDSVSTSGAAVSDAPGGSALYFAAAARLFGPVAVAGVVGRDFPRAPLEALAAVGVDVSGVSEALDPVPRVPEGLRSPAALFLGSTDPRVQAAVLDQMDEPAFVALDTASHWIEDRHEELVALLRRVDILVVNAEEAALLGGSKAPSLAAAAIRRLGPEWVVVKRGAEGAGAFGAAGEVLVPACRVGDTVDPTGAGDAFAGGLVASLAGDGALGAAALRRAMEAGVHAGAVAVTSCSVDALMALPHG